MKDIPKNKFKQYLYGHSVSNIFMDREGGYWMTTLNNGIYYTPRLDFQIYDDRSGLEDVFIKSLAIKNENEIFFGSINGELCWMNIVENKKIKLPSQPADMAIWDLLYDPKENMLWKGTRTLNRISLTDSIFQNSQWEEIYQKDSIKDNKVFFGNKRFVFSQNKKELLACNEFGFVRMDAKSKDIFEFSINNEKILPARTLIQFEDLENRVWIGNVNGLFEYKNKKLQPAVPHHPAFNLRVEDISQLKDSTLVIGTKGNGVVFWKGNEHKVLDESQGLTSNMIENIHIDNKEQIWVGTLLGLNKVKILKTPVDSTFFSIEHITSAHGLPSNEINRVRTIGNQVWVATSKGLVNFSNKTKNPKSLTPILERIQVNNEFVEERENLQLNHRRNNLVLKFLSFNYSLGGKIPYRYRLKPANDDWVYTCLLYTSPSPRDRTRSRMPSSA